MMEKYDSQIDTIEHINTVRRFMADVQKTNIVHRMIRHDHSKLCSPEKEIFDEFTPKLKNSTYGSEEYKGFLGSMKVGLDHHYKMNSHHAGRYENGIKDMSLLDILEMLIDWKAATLRHADGDILKSIELNQKRFGYSDELKNVLLKYHAGIKMLTTSRESRWRRGIDHENIS